MLFIYIHIHFQRLNHQKWNWLECQILYHLHIYNVHWNCVCLTWNVTIQDCTENQFGWNSCARGINSLKFTWNWIKTFKFILQHRKEAHFKPNVALFPFMWIVHWLNEQLNDFEIVLMNRRKKIMKKKIKETNVLRLIYKIVAGIDVQLSCFKLLVFSWLHFRFS